MNMYIQKLKEQLSQTLPYYCEGDAANVLEMLYTLYREKRCGDPPEIRQYFSQLDEILGKLTLKEYDKVWDVACGLCRAAEKEAFLEGVRVGASLTAELWEERA